MDTSVRGITVDGQGDIYVADRDAGSVEEYAADGTFIRDFGERGTDPGTFNGLYDIAVAPDGTLWIADLDNYWLQHFTADGHYLGEIDKWGPDGESFNPWAVAIYGDNLYAVDINGGTGDRVLVWGGLVVR